MEIIRELGRIIHELYVKIEFPFVPRKIILPSFTFMIFHACVFVTEISSNETLTSVT